MAPAKTTVRGRAPLARDSQQWMLDYLIQETGHVFHCQGHVRSCRMAALPRRLFFDKAMTIDRAPIQPDRMIRDHMERTATIKSP